jgi:ribosomal protein L6P/L9E
VSRIGKMPITVPAGVTVKIENNHVTVKGPERRTFSSDSQEYEAYHERRVRLRLSVPMMNKKTVLCMVCPVP